MPRGKQPPPPRGLAIISNMPLESIQIRPCPTHPAGPYICHCQRDDAMVRALARAMLEEMLAQLGTLPTRVSPSPIPAAPPSVPPPAPTPDDPPMTDDDDPAVPPMAPDVHNEMVKAALARRAQRESISVLRRPNVTEG